MKMNYLHSEVNKISALKLNFNHASMKHKSVAYDEFKLSVWFSERMRILHAWA